MTSRSAKAAAVVAWLASVLAVTAWADCGRQDPAVVAWILNDGSHGQSPDPTIDAAVSRILADVQRVRFTATDAYVEATGVPRYPVGPFPDGNPNVPSNQNWLWRIPRQPQQATPTGAATGLGPIGTWVNGVALFNPRDARSYQNMDVWHQNAVVVEAAGFDAALGHPEMRGAYHHHQQPVALLAQLGDDGTRHSSVVGFGFDGFPVYGPYGFANPDGSGGVVRMRSSYRLRSITARDTLPDGTPLPMAQWGPSINATYPLGYYIEDFEYVAGLGDLDASNGRFAVTPEYPAGTWAYYTTTDASGASAYPYSIGPNYHGVVAQDDLRRTVSVPAGACTYSASCVEGDCPGGCTDGIDDDLDGRSDCADSDCASDPACAGIDSDGDTVPDPADCAPTDPSAFATPPEILDLRVAKAPTAGWSRLSWSDVSASSGTGVRYDVAGEALAVMRAARDAAPPCVARDLPATSWDDMDTAPGVDLYWLVHQRMRAADRRGLGQRERRHAASRVSLSAAAASYRQARHPADT